MGVMEQQEFFKRYNYSPLHDLLGEGGFGKVYRAYDNVLDREVAIKVAAVRQVGGKIFSLKDECATAMSIPPHQYVASYDSIHTFEFPTGVSDFAVMQYYPDGNLKALLEQKSLPFASREQLVWALLEGLEHLHKHHIIHRDLKPANVLLVARRRGEELLYIPKIADFGLAKIVDDLHSHISSSFAGGTIGYSSPEQLKGQAMRYNSDLWSWAVIAYELLTEQKLFDTDASSSAYSEGGMVDLILRQDLSSKLAVLPSEWQTLLSACLVREPEQRIANITALRGLVGEVSHNTQIQQPDKNTEPSKHTSEVEPIKQSSNRREQTPPSFVEKFKDWLRTTHPGLSLSIACIALSMPLPVMTLYEHFLGSELPLIAFNWRYSLVSLEYLDIEFHPLPLIASILWGGLLYLASTNKKLWLSLASLGGLTFIILYLLLQLLRYELGRYLYSHNSLGELFERVELNFGYYLLLFASCASLVACIQLWRTPQNPSIRTWGGVTTTLFLALIIIYFSI